MSPLGTERTPIRRHSADWLYFRAEPPPYKSGRQRIGDILSCERWLRYLSHANSGSRARC